MEKTKFKCIAIVQVFNELDKGNLKRYFKYMRPFVEKIIVYDDFSTDGSYEYCLSNADVVFRGTKNEFSKEIFHKQKLLDEALIYDPDFIFSLDVDEIFSHNASSYLDTILQKCIDNDFDGIEMLEVNLWRSPHWKRVDSLFGDGKFVRIWRCKKGIKFEKIQTGLHQRHYPTTIKKIMKTNEISLLHFGFSDERNIAQKYLTYKAHGQKGYDDLNRLIDEKNLKLEKVEEKLLPPEIRVLSSIRPKRKTYSEAMAYVLKYKKVIDAPKFSFVCLIYKSTGWLDFVYSQLLKYTPITDSEIIFIANDADEDVIAHLTANYYKFVVHQNTEEQRKEWYINNVYRAWNKAGDVAEGNYLIFINSDMAFSPNWFEKLIASYDGVSVLSPRGVESGKYDAGVHGVTKNFGRSYEEFEEEKFLIFANNFKEQQIKEGGIFMPLFIRKEIFNQIGRYPEGNIKADSDLYFSKIAKQGDALISGDAVLMSKLKDFGVTHKTVFDSVIYHFQCGESENDKISSNKLVKIAICNDICGGAMGERVLWNDLLDNLPGSYPVDKKRVGSSNFEAKAREYVEQNGADLIIQNASFMNLISREQLTIVYLQDDLRAMGKPSLQQETNLKLADLIVTNTVHTMLSYHEFEMECIPVGVNEKLFRPMSQKGMRRKHQIPEKFIGIFVGSLNDVKGWPKVSRFIEQHPEMHFIVVSKHEENYNSVNVSFYSQITQQTLVELLNCANFFLIGSPIETQCLAAIEANLCGLPVLMPLVGIYKEFSAEERKNVGIFTEDFDEGLIGIKAFKGNPREQIISKGLTIENTLKSWQDLILRVIQAKQLNSFKNRDSKSINRKNKLTSALVLFIRLYFFKPVFGSRYLNINDKLTLRFVRKALVEFTKKMGFYENLKRIRDELRKKL